VVCMGAAARWGRVVGFLFMQLLPGGEL